jgi:hypothetical protein
MNNIMKSKIVYVEKAGEDYTSIKVVEEGPYQGVIFSFGKIKIEEPEEKDGKAILSFDFIVDTVPPILGKTAEEVENNDEFKQYAGDILVGIIEETVEDHEIRKWE